eukprot:5560263-Pyramimonas_sp.AAC.1
MSRGLWGLFATGARGVHLGIAIVNPLGWPETASRDGLVDSKQCMLSMSLEAPQKTAEGPN